MLYNDNDQERKVKGEESMNKLFRIAFTFKALSWAEQRNEVNIWAKDGIEAMKSVACRLVEEGFEPNQFVIYNITEE